MCVCAARAPRCENRVHGMLALDGSGARESDGVGGEAGVRTGEGKLLEPDPMGASAVASEAMASVHARQGGEPALPRLRAAAYLTTK